MPGFAVVRARATLGMEAPSVRVEARTDGGLPAFGIVGLPEAAVREARDRVRGALTTCNFVFPNGRITVNLAPADLPKGGGRFDLPIALAILAASDQLDPAVLEDVEILGELSLNGEMRPVRGALPASLAATQAGRRLIVPAANGPEAALPEGSRIVAAEHLLAVIDHLSGRAPLPEQAPSTGDGAAGPAEGAGRLADVRGHLLPKRALVVAAAGGHNLLMRGPPGTGKTLLARCLPGLMPPLTRAESLEVAAIRSLSGHLITALPRRPFRAPHHSATGAALVGGGSDPVPGEISLAHHGVLFLDEMPEFARSVLETLREPMESGEIVIARARARVAYPARFQLVAAMNPCPAGHDCRGQGAACVCPPDAARRYAARLSGPLLDRIDLHVPVPPVPIEILAHGDPTADPDEDAKAREQVREARARACARQGRPNAQLNAPETERLCRPDAEGLALLERAASRLGLSARSWHRTLRCARTLADLAGRRHVDREDIAEALAFRDPAGGTARVPGPPMDAARGA